MITRRAFLSASTGLLACPVLSGCCHNRQDRGSGTEKPSKGGVILIQGKSELELEERLQRYRSPEYNVAVREHDSQSGIWMSLVTLERTIKKIPYKVKSTTTIEFAWSETTSDRFKAGDCYCRAIKNGSWNVPGNRVESFLELRTMDVSSNDVWHHNFHVIWMPIQGTLAVTESQQNHFDVGFSWTTVTYSAWSDAFDIDKIWNQSLYAVGDC